MKDWSSENRGPNAPRWIGGEMEALGRASILLVEDDRDIRDLLVALLQMAGFDAEPCATAEEALDQLREGTFDLVLTDYMLPHRSGAWLLQQASEEGLLDATPVLIVTAHPNPAETNGYEIVRKPFDLDELVERVRLRLEGVPRPRVPRSTRTPPGSAGRRGSDDSGDVVELILYVSAHSPRSAAAIANVKKVLSRFESSRVKLTIHDLSKEPSRGEDDRIAFTPTLVKRSPGPRTFILGHMANTELLVELLEGCCES